MATPYPRYGVDARKDMGNEYPICALRPVLSSRFFEGFCLSISAGPERYASGFLWPATCASFLNTLLFVRRLGGRIEIVARVA